MKNSPNTGLNSKTIQSAKSGPGSEDWSEQTPRVVKQHTPYIMTNSGLVFFDARLRQDASTFSFQRDEQGRMNLVAAGEVGDKGRDARIVFILPTLARTLTFKRPNTTSIAGKLTFGNAANYETTVTYDGSSFEKTYECPFPARYFIVEPGQYIQLIGLSWE
ncbi:hypothetical protein BW687_014355 [Pseudomonas graminis]|uniref:hypothetical protein n=1 Tax=Pseudomonas graminis TaxID=158627 RepID=UPI00234B2C53|nr:hypothetical protein [Pseudomonas graminis]MDC6381346.1 hypothetical protein [Pseudomonas graminis]